MVNIDDELSYLKPFLTESKNEWEWKVTQLITQIPSGHLITYGELARWTREEYDLSICARNTANCRRKIYHILRERKPDFKMPLHRIIKKEDIWGAEDSDRTRPDNEKKRRPEGSWIPNPIMYKP